MAIATERLKPIAFEMFERGYSYRAIVKALDVSESTAKRWRKAYGNKGLEAINNDRNSANKSHF